MTAAKTLIRSGTASLPVSVSALAEKFGIKLVDYNAFVQTYELSKDELYSKISYGGFSLIAEGRYVCVLNSGLCGQSRRKWTAAHEVGHVLCGHVTGTDPVTHEQEREADRFAAELLAPLTVLHFCGVSSALEIERLCGISRQAASARFNELSELRRTDESRFTAALRSGETPPESIFLQTEENRELFRWFSPFITSYITRRSAHDGYGKYLEMKSRERMAI